MATAMTGRSVGATRRNTGDTGEEERREGKESTGEYQQQQLIYV